MSLLTTSSPLHRYPYISHLICNAGCAFWTGVDKILAAKVIVMKGLSWSITLPPFKLQHTGRMSADGLGCTWQSNVFGHYIMVRAELFALLKVENRLSVLVSPSQASICQIRGTVLSASPAHLDELAGRPAVLV